MRIEVCEIIISTQRKNDLPSVELLLRSVLKNGGSLSKQSPQNSDKSAHTTNQGSSQNEEELLKNELLSVKKKIRPDNTINGEFELSVIFDFSYRLKEYRDSMVFRFSPGYDNFTFSISIDYELLGYRENIRRLITLFKNVDPKLDIHCVYFFPYYEGNEETIVEAEHNLRSNNGIIPDTLPIVLPKTWVTKIESPGLLLLEEFNDGCYFVHEALILVHSEREITEKDVEPSFQRIEYGDVYSFQSSEEIDAFVIKVKEVARQRKALVKDRFIINEKIGDFKAVCKSIRSELEKDPTFSKATQLQYEKEFAEYYQQTIKKSKD